MINRKALFAGVFLAAAGAVMLVGEGSAAAADVITQALRLWPLAVIAIGLGLLARHTRLGLAGTMVAAAIPGLLLGGVVVAAPTVDMSAICDRTEGAATTSRTGTFDGPATVDLDLACGDLSVTTNAGRDWSVNTLDLPGHRATIIDSGTRLAVSSNDGRRSWGLGRDGDRWRIALPTDLRFDLDASINAGSGRLDLADARIGRLGLEVNAGDARADLTGAAVSRLDVHVNAGSARVILPAADLTGDVAASAGSIEICAPSDLGIRATGDAVLGDTTFNGLIRAGDAWETPGYSTSTHQAELSVSASAGSVVINPQGGCK